MFDPSGLELYEAIGLPKNLFRKARNTVAGSTSVMLMKDIKLGK